MIAAPIPDNDAERVAALHALLILDTAPEDRYDKILNFVAAEFGVPIALVSLVDSERQWFKAQFGLTVCETARDMSFCGHAILRPDIMVVPDALLDPRFADNPLVTDPPHIRFYAGAPLLLPNGLALGTLCLIDTAPRQLEAVDLAILATLRDLVMLEVAPQAPGAGNSDA